MWAHAFLLLAAAAQPHFLSHSLFQAIAAEFSGEKALAHVRRITESHRIQASPGFHEAAEYVRSQAQAMGLEDAHIESFPSDGRTRYQTHVSPLSWTVREGELWVEEPFRLRLCRFSDVATCLSTLSNGGKWRGQAVDVGPGTLPRDYAGQDVRGKVVLASGYAGTVHRQAVLERGALGVVIYPSATDRPEFPDLVRYNGLWPAAEEMERVTFGFQISRRQYERLRAVLAAGQTLVLSATVDASIHTGNLEVVSARIPPAAGEKQPAADVLFTAHLDHYRPGANDNASGSASLLEIARTFSTLLREKKLPPLRRGLRFLWVPEHFGTMAYLDKHRGSDQAYMAGLNLDMTGEDLVKTNSRLRITSTPASLPSFLNVLLEDVARQVEAANLFAPTGTRNLFHWTMAPYEPGSDHDMLNDSGVAVPATMLGHAPDPFHHTDQDSVDKLDATTLKRVGVLASTAAGWMATAGAEDWKVMAERFAADEIAPAVAEALKARPSSPRALLARERVRRGLAAIVAAEPDPAVLEHAALLRQNMGTLPEERSAGAAGPRPRRKYFGPLADSYGSQWFRRALGEQYAWWEEQRGKVPGFELIVYEIANFTDGNRTVAEIEAAVSDEYGPLPAGLVEGLLRRLAAVGLVEF